MADKHHSGSNHLRYVLGATVAGSLALGAMAAQADTNPFQVAELGSGYMVAANMGEGNCSGKATEQNKGQEGNCSGKANSMGSQGSSGMGNNSMHNGSSNGNMNGSMGNQQKSSHGNKASEGNCANS